jgi:deazaflavin-dependent oxidoreductase (nitroreductase family)
MPATDSYREPVSPYVKRQLQLADEVGDLRSVHSGDPIIVVTVRGAKSGLLRRVPVMRVEHDGRFAMVASLGGAPKHPLWYHSVVANPVVSVLDGNPRDGLTETVMRARELHGAERELWWRRSVAAFPPYAQYQVRRPDRPFPILLLEPAPTA